MIRIISDTGRNKSATFTNSSSCLLWDGNQRKSFGKLCHSEKETIKGYGHKFSLSLFYTFLHLRQIYLEICAALLLAVMVELALPVHHVGAPAMELHFPLPLNIINVVWVRNMKIHISIRFERKASQKSWWWRMSFKNPLNYSDTSL